MRSHAEWALRAVTLAALGTLLWRWTHPVPAAGAPPDVVQARDTAASGAALRRWTSSSTAAGHLTLRGAPDAVTRDWMRALRGAGMRLTWSATDASPLAMTAESLIDPAGGVRVSVSGAEAAVGDAYALASAADTVRSARGGAVVLPASGEAVLARSSGTTARVAAPTTPKLGAVVVLGRAGWEAKFVAAALEERGWSVRTRLAVAPGVVVTQQGASGAAATTSDVIPDARDTATTAAVVVLDTGVVDATGAARLARYVRAGGGLVMAGDAGSTASLRALAAGSSGTSLPGSPNALDGATPRRGLALLPVAPSGDAVVLERRDGASEVAVAARRVGAGRVAQSGYVETWRWRMSADDAAPAAHRAWWARLVGAVAYASRARGGAVPDDSSAATRDDPAPLASAVAALGLPTSAPSATRRGIPVGRWPADGWLAAIAALALLGEVASRRMRGQRSPSSVVAPRERGNGGSIRTGGSLTSSDRVIPSAARDPSCDATHSARTADPSLRSG